MILLQSPPKASEKNQESSFEVQKFWRKFLKNNRKLLILRRNRSIIRKSENILRF
jgi:hypothetical protein